MFVRRKKCYDVFRETKSLGGNNFPLRFYEWDDSDSCEKVISSFPDNVCLIRKKIREEPKIRTIDPICNL